jgi:hypothetical protein
MLCLYQNVSSNYQSEACLQGPGGAHAPQHVQAWAGLVLKYFYFTVGMVCFVSNREHWWGGLGTETPPEACLGQRWLIFFLCLFLLLGALAFPWDHCYAWTLNLKLGCKAAERGLYFELLYLSMRWLCHASKCELKFSIWGLFIRPLSWGLFLKFFKLDCGNVCFVS